MRMKVLHFIFGLTESGASCWGSHTGQSTDEPLITQSKEVLAVLRNTLAAQSCVSQITEQGTISISL